MAVNIMKSMSMWDKGTSMSGANVEGEVDKAIVPPLLGLYSRGPLRSSILGNKPLVNTSLL